MSKNDSIRQDNAKLAVELADSVISDLENQIFECDQRRTSLETELGFWRRRKQEDEAIVADLEHQGPDSD